MQGAATSIEDIVLNYDPEFPQERFRAAGVAGADKSFDGAIAGCSAVARRPRAGFGAAHQRAPRYRRFGQVHRFRCHNRQRSMPDDPGLRRTGSAETTFVGHTRSRGGFVRQQRGSGAEHFRPIQTRSPTSPCNGGVDGFHSWLTQTRPPAPHI
jgi:hypothetical protein